MQMALRLLFLFVFTAIGSGIDGDSSVCQLPLANLCPILHYPPQDRCYFDGERCMVFTYWGCEGNGNNFLTCDACESLCLGATSSTLSTQATAQPLSHQHTESTTLHYNHPDATGPADHTTTQQWTVQRLTTAAATVQEHTTGTQPESTVQNPTTRTLITTTETVEQSTEKRPGLNTYGYIVITIGIVLVLLVGVSVVLVVTVIWRVIRVRLLHTKIMHKEEPVVLASFGLTMMSSSSSHETSAELPPEIPTGTPHNSTALP